MHVYTATDQVIPFVCIDFFLNYICFVRVTGVVVWLMIRLENDIDQHSSRISFHTVQLSTNNVQFKLLRTYANWAQLKADAINSR